MSSSEQPAAKQPKLACPINELADELLLRIFKLLPPHERLIVSEVCKRWNELSKSPWRDVITLDVSTFGYDDIGAYTKKCPNMRSVFARGAYFDDGDDLHVLSRVNLSSLKLYNCSGNLHEKDGAGFDLFVAMFSERLPQASWDELVLHNSDIKVDVDSCKSCYGCSIISTLPTSLKRLQLSGDLKLTFDGLKGVWKPSGEDLFEGISRLQNLSCLMLYSSDDKCLLEQGIASGIRDLPALTSLVELCVRTEHEEGFEGMFRHLVDCCFELPKLEVLFVGNVMLQDSWALNSVESLTKLATKHPTLRHLVLTEWVHLRGVQTIPARRLYPNGFGSDPLPLLHVFLGNEAAEKIRFEESPSDAIKIYEITQPLPTFLEREEIAPIFEGVWIAAQVKEGAKNGAKLWQDDDDNGSVSSSDDVQA